MSITARCGGCQKVYKVDDHWAGKKVRCKNCGGVITIPKVVVGLPVDEGGGVSSRPAAKPARPAAARPAAKPAKSADPADPFGNLDDLLALEQTGTVQEAPPIPRGRGRSAPAQPTQDEAPRDDKVGAAVQRKTSTRRVHGAPQAQPQPTRYYSDQTFTMPGEDAIDSYLPVICMGAVVLALLWPLFLAIRTATNLPPGFAFNWARWSGWWVGFVAGTGVVVFGLLAPLAMLAVHVGSAIMKFAKPENLYKRCATIVCAPMAINLILGFMALASGTALPLDPIMLAFFNLVVLMGALLVMTRLKIAPFAVTGAFVFLLVVIVPWVLFTLVIGSRFGMITGRGFMR